MQIGKKEEIQKEEDSENEDKGEDTNVENILSPESVR